MTVEDDVKALAHELSIVAAKCPVGSLTRTTLEAGIQAAKTPGMHPLALIVSMTVGMARALDQLFLNLAGIEELQQKEAEEWLKQQEAGNAEAGGVTDVAPSSEFLEVVGLLILSSALIASMISLLWFVLMVYVGTYQ